MGFPVGVSRNNSNYNGGSAGYTGMTVQSNTTLYTDMTIASDSPVGMCPFNYENQYIKILGMAAKITLASLHVDEKYVSDIYLFDSGFNPAFLMRRSASLSSM